MYLQSYINQQFNFLDNFEYMYEQSSSESEMPGPFSRSFQALDEEREEDRDRWGGEGRLGGRGEGGRGKVGREDGDRRWKGDGRDDLFLCVCVCV